MLTSSGFSSLSLGLSRHHLRTQAMVCTMLIPRLATLYHHLLEVTPMVVTINTIAMPLVLITLWELQLLPLPLHPFLPGIAFLHLHLNTLALLMLILRLNTVTLSPLLNSMRLVLSLLLLHLRLLVMRQSISPLPLAHLNTVITLLI